MTVEGESAALLEAGAASERLKVSPSGLRRLSGIYEAIHGELPRKPKTNNRLWPAVAVERLEAARALVDAECFRSISEALEALAGGYKPELIVEGLDTSQTGARLSGELVAELLGELRAVRGELAKLREDNAALRLEVRQIAAPAAIAADVPHAAMRATPELQDRISEIASETGKGGEPAGVLVRVARRLERWLSRS